MASYALGCLTAAYYLTRWRLGKDLRAAGYLVSFNSEYLLARNWLQICLMGEWSSDALGELITLLGERAGIRLEDPSDRVSASVAGRTATG